MWEVLGMEALSREIWGVRFAGIFAIGIHTCPALKIH